MLMKYRDYVARLTDESTNYVLPNHALFQVAARLPETRSELRDCLRQSWQGPIVGHADELLRLLKVKLERSHEKAKKRKENQHVLLEQVPAAQNPEAVAYKRQVSDCCLEQGSLPEFRVKCAATKKFQGVFSAIETTANPASVDF